MGEVSKITEASPYKIFFPLGYCLLIAGVGIWSLDPLGGAFGFHFALLLQSAYLTFVLGIVLTESPSLLRSASAGKTVLVLFAVTTAGAGLASTVGAIPAALACLLLSASGLWAFLFFRLASIREHRHPGPYIVFTALHFLIFGITSALASRMGLMRWEAGATMLRSGALGFALLVPVALLRWEGNMGLRKSILPFPGFMIGGVALLCADLALEMAGSRFEDQPWLLRTAYALRISWIAWYLRTPGKALPILASLPAAIALLRVYLALQMAALALSMFDPGRTLVFTAMAQIMGSFLLVVPIALLLAYSRLSAYEWKAARGISLIAGWLLLAAFAFRLGASYSDTMRIGLMSAAIVTALGPIFLWFWVYFPSGISRIARGFPRPDWSRHLFGIRGTSNPIG